MIELEYNSMGFKLKNFGVSKYSQNQLLTSSRFLHNYLLGIFSFEHKFSFYIFTLQDDPMTLNT